MRKLNASIIASGKAMPVKSGTLGHLQYAYGELFAELLQELYPGSTLVGNNVTAVRGCAVSGSSPTYNLAAGAIFVGGSVSGMVEGYGELFLLPTAQSTTTSGDDNAILVLTITNFSAANADPVTFTDGTSNNVHQIRTLTLTHGDYSTAGYICDLSSLANTNAFGSNHIRAVITAAGSSGNIPVGTNTIFSSVTPSATLSSSSMLITFNYNLVFDGHQGLTFTIVNSRTGARQTATYTASTDEGDTPDITLMGTIMAYDTAYEGGDTYTVNVVATGSGTSSIVNMTMVCECFDAH